jgi:uncharacterized protein YycO
MKLQVPVFLIKLMGDIYLHKFPMWCVYKPSHHKVKGFEVRKIIKALKTGDIILRRYNGYLNTLFTPGFWGHAGLYAGNDKVIHAVGKGVIMEDILDFCRTDSVAVLRIKNMKNPMLKKALSTARIFLKEHVQYDYRFRDENGKVYCTEMVNECYNHLFNKDYSNYFGNKILSPDGLFNSQKVKQIISIKH